MESKALRAILDEAQEYAKRNFKNTEFDQPDQRMTIYDFIDIIENALYKSED